MRFRRISVLDACAARLPWRHDPLAVVPAPAKDKLGKAFSSRMRHARGKNRIPVIPLAVAVGGREDLRAIPEAVGGRTKRLGRRIGFAILALLNCAGIGEPCNKGNKNETRHTTLPKVHNKRLRREGKGREGKGREGTDAEPSALPESHFSSYNLPHRHRTVKRKSNIKRISPESPRDSGWQALGSHQRTIMPGNRRDFLCPGGSSGGLSALIHKFGDVLRPG